MTTMHIPTCSDSLAPAARGHLGDPTRRVGVGNGNALAMACRLGHALARTSRGADAEALALEFAEVVL